MPRLAHNQEKQVRFLPPQPNGSEAEWSPMSKERARIHEGRPAGLELEGIGIGVRVLGIQASAWERVEVPPLPPLSEAL